MTTKFIKHTNIITFDAEDFDGQKLELKIQLKNGGFQKIFEFNLDAIATGNDPYLPVFKVGISGHSFHSNVDPRP